MRHNGIPPSRPGSEERSCEAKRRKTYLASVDFGDGRHFYIVLLWKFAGGVDSQASEEEENSN